MFGRPRIGLALGGGAARGFAHIGVLKILEKEGIPVDLITGTSVGAFIGAGYCLMRDADLLEERFKEFVTSKEFSESRYEFLKEEGDKEYGIIKNLEMLIKKGIFLGYAVTKRSFISPEVYEKSIAFLLGDARMEDLAIPFASNALDIKTGKEVVITTGSLKEAVWASSAIPGFLPPVERNGYLLADGGWIDKIPILPAYFLGADVVIAVDISSEMEDTKEFTKGYEIMIRARAASDAFFNRTQSSYADLVLRPDVGHIHWADFSKAGACIEEGEKACRTLLPDLKRITSKGLFSRIFSRREKKDQALSCLSHLIRSESVIKL